MVLPVPALADGPHKIVVGGTGTALGGMQLLADAFAKSHSGYSVNVLPSLGSGGGIRAVAAGKIDIAVSARPPKKKERIKPLAVTEYARTPIVFGTHPNTNATGVTGDQLLGIYKRGARWPDGSHLRLILRPAGESDTKLLCGISKDVCAVLMKALKRPELFVAMNDQDNALALETTPGSFGLTTLAQVKSEKRSIKLLTFNGVSGTVENVENKAYPYYKSLFYVLRPDASPAAQAFIEFTNSPVGQEMLASSGHLTVSGQPAVN